MTQRRVVVLGAGISGLTAAYRLARGEDAPHVTVVERDLRVGGKIRTHREGELVFDGGPDAFVSAKKDAADLCREIGLGEALIETTEANRRVLVRRDGRFVPMPEGVVLTVPTEIRPLVASPLFTLPGVLRMGLDLVLPRRTDPDDESIASFVERRLGRQALETLGEPLLGGLFVGDPATLSIKAAFPQLVALETEHRSLVLGTLKTRKKKRGPPPSAFFSLRGGMATLPERLRDEVVGRGVELALGTEAVRIERRERGYAVLLRQADHERYVVADAVVVALPANRAAALLGSFDAGLQQILGGVPFLSSATVVLAYPKRVLARSLDAVGALLPKREGRRALALTFVTSKWEGRAPDDVAVFRLFFGGHGRQDDARLPEDELIAMAIRELDELGLVRGDPTTHRVFRYLDANPQPVLGHLDRMRQLREALAPFSGLHVVGSGYDGVGIPDCVRQASAAAARILADRRV